MNGTTMIALPDSGRAQRYLDSLETELAASPERHRDAELRRVRAQLHAYTAAGLSSGMDETEAVDFALRRVSDPVATLGESARVWFSSMRDSVPAGLLLWFGVQTLAGLAFSLLIVPLLDIKGPDGIQNALEIPGVTNALRIASGALSAFITHGLGAYAAGRVMPKSIGRVALILLALAIVPIVSTYWANLHLYGTDPHLYRVSQVHYLPGPVATLGGGILGAALGLWKSAHHRRSA